MKKLIRLVLFIVLLIPLKIGAYDAGISNYFVDATVQSNGDLLVKELFVLEGEFNGFERIINFRNPNAPTFDGSVESFMGSDIYNGTDVQITKVKAINATGAFEDLSSEGQTFNKVLSADTGDYGVYTEDKSSVGTSIRIYNPNSYGTRGFYVEYIVKDLGIVHNDIAEIGWNIFSNELDENIGNFELHMNIPHNEELLKGWAHGPLYGNIEIVDKNSIKVTITELDRNTAMDVRFVFDKTVLSNSKKTTSFDALDKIIEGETKKADEANEVREEAEKEIQREKTLGLIMTVVDVLYLFGLGIVIVYNYKKYDKEYQSAVKLDYYRDFPANYGPEIVGYLMRKSISDKDLGATILNLIYKKNIKYEEIDKKDYRLVLNNNEGLTSSEIILMNWIFEDGNSITVKEFQKKAKSSYSSFLKNYELWKREASREAQGYSFFEENGSKKAAIALYSLIGFGLIFLSNEHVSIIIKILLVWGSFMTLIYILASKKRTIKGNDDYNKWMALKRFMLDFGNMKEKELPEIILWEKYLVYAVVFGIAEKLAKTMAVKIAEFSNNSNYNTTIYNPGYFNSMMLINNSISSGMSSAVITANNERVAASSRSSGSGFGGGFSGGGGSFGGGGGGGRF